MIPDIQSCKTDHSADVDMCALSQELAHTIAADVMQFCRDYVECDTFYRNYDCDIEAALSDDSEVYCWLRLSCDKQRTWEYGGTFDEILRDELIDAVVIYDCTDAARYDADGFELDASFVEDAVSCAQSLINDEIQ
jgi:hypothetical protein